MSPQEMATLAKHPLITLGGHTITHVQLASLDRAGQSKEIVDSLNFVESVADCPVETFSYPYGLWGRDFNQKSIESVEKSGLNHALAADINVVTSRTNPFKIPRLWISDVGQPQFGHYLGRWL